jgi:hypothetical protein
MTYLDTAVLNLVERLCRRFQKLTGKTNAWLAFQLTNLSVVVYFTWVVILYWLSASVAVRVFVAMFCGGIFIVLTRTLFRSSLDVAEQAAYRRVAKGVRNPRRIRDAQLRIAFLSLSLLLLGPLVLAYIRLRVRFALLTELLLVVTTLLLYVLACDPLPPCPSRVREWIRQLAPGRAPAAQPADAD